MTVLRHYGGAPWSADLEPVAGARVDRPLGHWTCLMQGEVDDQFPFDIVITAWRVVTAFFAAIGGRHENLDVVVGCKADEIAKIIAGQCDAAHAGSDVDDALDRESALSRVVADPFDAGSR
jgi:hypothetical protein